MKKSKFFGRVFSATLFLYLFFLISSTVVGFYNSPDYIFYNVGIVFALVFFYLLMIGFKKREFATDLNGLVKKAAEEAKHIR